MLACEPASLRLEVSALYGLVMLLSKDINQIYFIYLFYFNRRSKLTYINSESSI